MRKQHPNVATIGNIRAIGRSPPRHRVPDPPVLCDPFLVISWCSLLLGGALCYVLLHVDTGEDQYRFGRSGDGAGEVPAQVVCEHGGGVASGGVDGAGRTEWCAGRSCAGFFWPSESCGWGRHRNKGAASLRERRRGCHHSRCDCCVCCLCCVSSGSFAAVVFAAGQACWQAFVGGELVG